MKSGQDAPESNTAAVDKINLCAKDFVSNRTVRDIPALIEVLKEQSKPVQRFVDGTGPKDVIGFGTKSHQSRGKTVETVLAWHQNSA